MPLTKLTASTLLSKYSSGDLTAVDVVTDYLKRIDRENETCGAYLEVFADDAIAQAKSIDQRRLKGNKLGTLAGIPIAVKDLICMTGKKTTCGSRMLANYVPPYDATVVTKLREADAILIGKTNLDEFAMGGSTEYSAFRKSSNPWDIERTPGGSSGGSAVAVSADLAPLSLGTDTGGSIRQPAAYCGISGLKPTYGSVSRYGLVAFASSLDQIGPMARDSHDLALLFNAIAGPDSRDSTSDPRPASPVSIEETKGEGGKPLAGIRLGRVKEIESANIDSTIAQAIATAMETCQQLGAEIVDVSLPHLPYGVATYYVLAPCEASGNLARYDGVHYGHRPAWASSLADVYAKARSEGFGAEVKRRIMLGTFALSEGYYDAYYRKALQVRRLIRDDYRRAFQQCDLLIGPTTPTTAFKLGEKTSDPVSMYLEDIFTVPANLAGIPALSIPCGFDEQQLPIGLQLQAGAFEEARLLQVAAAFQSVTEWHAKRSNS